MLRNKTTDQQRIEANMSILREERIKLHKAYAEAIETVGRLKYTIQEVENKLEELEAMVPITAFEAERQTNVWGLTALEAGAIQRQTNAWVLEGESEPDRLITAVEAGHITRDTNAWVPDDESDELFASTM